jgi:branched-chain amino acid transport system substrate-binding protein
MSSKCLRLLPICLLLALVLAACGPSEPVAETGEESEFDCTVRIGSALSETGRFAREGVWNKRGYETWREWANDEYGGIKVGDQRCKAEIVYYDDETDPDTSAKLIEKLINEDKVDFLLGPYSSTITLGTSAIAEKYGVIMVEAHGASDALFERGFENLFAVLTPASYYSESALKALADEGAKTVAIAYLDDEAMEMVVAGAKEWVDKYGLELLAVEKYPADITDLSAIMTKFRDLDPDVFLGAGHFNDSVLFVRNAQELGFAPTAMVLTVGPDSPAFVEELGEDADYVMGPAQWDRTLGYEDEYFGTAADYAERYTDRWGEAPPYQSASSTAAALALHLAIEQAGSLEMDAVREALRNLDVETFYGPINFDDTGKNTAKSMVTIQIQDGAVTVVAPKEAAAGEMALPMPAWEER